MFTFTVPKMLGLMLLVAGMVLLFLGGCADQTKAIYHSTIVARAGVQATTPLVATGVVNRDVGVKVDVAGRTASSALVAWNNARVSGDQNALTTAGATAVAALTTLETQLAALATSHTKSARAKSAGEAAKAQLQVARIRQVVEASSDGKKKLGVEASVLILQIAVQELPALVNWINSALNSNTVSDAQVQTELDGLAADLGALESVLNP